mgnify:CR=1 FL=1
MNEIADLLNELTMSKGVSGYEFPLSQKVRDMFSNYCQTSEIDSMGNVTAILNPECEGKTLMLEAHIDEIGLIVSGIEENGRIKFQTIGGIDAAILPSSSVTVHGREDITGVIGAKPPHLQTADESKNRYTVQDLFIDTYMTKEQLTQKVRIGDSISFNSKPRTLLGNIYSSKSIDNRGGTAALLLCAKALKEKGFKGRVVFLLSVQEEVGMRGAQVGSYNIKPDMAVVVDVTHGITPMVNAGDGFPLGSGAALGAGPNIDPKIFEGLKAVCEKNSLPYTVEVCADNTGTDAWVIQVQAGGIPCGLVSFPLRYMHSHIETVSLEDIKNTVKLLSEFAGEVL